MTGVRLEYDADAAVAGLSAQLARLGDPSGAIRESAEALHSSTLDRFEREQGPDGAAWLPSQRARRARGQTLTESGRLRASIDSSADDNRAAVGTNVAYAAIHQFGGAIERKARTQVLAFDKKRHRFRSRRSARRQKTGAVQVAVAQIGAHAIKTPARPFLGISGEDRAEISHIFADWMRGS